jgi:hypothetical protein
VEASNVRNCRGWRALRVSQLLPIAASRAGRRSCRTDVRICGSRTGRPAHSSLGIEPPRRESVELRGDTESNQV